MTPTEPTPSPAGTPASEPERIPWALIIGVIIILIIAGGVYYIYMRRR